MDEASNGNGRSCSSCLMKQLPPGFRFSPTDEELILHFLLPMVKSSSSSSSSSSSTSSSLIFSHSIIPDLRAMKLDPWELNGRALSSGNEYFYFSRVKQNRGTNNGYWKDMDTEEPIFSTSVAANGRIRIGTKKLMVFHINGGHHGAATEGGEEETNWVMEEYRLNIPGNVYGSTDHHSYYKWFGNQRQEHGSMVLCRVHERKNRSIGQNLCWDNYNCDGETEISSLDEMFLSLDDDLDDITSPY